MKKNIYKLLDEAAEQYVPDNFDSIMDEIEKMPTAETPDVYSFTEKRSAAKHWKYAVAAACLCAVIVAGAIVTVKTQYHTLFPGGTEDSERNSYNNSALTGEILWNKGKRYDSEWFRFIYDHRNELVEKNGEKVLNFIVQVLFHQVYPYMMFEKVYDMDFISEIEQKAGHLEFTSLNRDQLLDMCKILHFRQQKKYSEMLDLWGKMVPNLPNEALKVRYDATLGRLQDMNETEKKQAIAYLKERMAGMTGSTLERYRQIVTELSDYQGIRFETGGLQEALAKARKENKAVFVDCYTSWCGPCKMMSSKVFPDKQAGDFFNPRFISLKIDMEKDEGKELAQKWNIRVFPTYLILDPQGEIVYTSQGYIPAEELIRRMNEGLEQWKNNIKTGK